VVVNGEDVYLVEKILDARMRHNKPNYLVKWVGYPPEQATWEPLEHVAETIALDEWELAHGPLRPSKRQKTAP
jgi:hypothetical protein